jgi:DNA-binding XRE family transcriptional regulator
VLSAAIRHVAPLSEKGTSFQSMMDYAILDYAEVEFIIPTLLWQAKSGDGMEKTIYTAEYAVLLRLLKEAREQAGLTQVDLAKKLRQSQSFVSKIECGDRRLDVIQLRTVCKILGLTLPSFIQRLEDEIRKHK